MSEQQPVRGRPPEGDVIKVRDFADNRLTAYLEAVRSAQGLKTRSAAGRMVLEAARATGQFLSGIDTTLAAK